MGTSAGLLSLLLGALYFLTFVESQCQPEPVVASIEDVSLSNGASVRGISMTVGSNNQNISFLASG